MFLMRFRMHAFRTRLELIRRVWALASRKERGCTFLCWAVSPQPSDEEYPSFMAAEQLALL